MAGKENNNTEQNYKKINYVILGTVVVVVITIIGILIYGVAAGKFKSGFEFFSLQDTNGTWVVLSLLLLGGITFFALGLIFYFMHKKHVHDEWSSIMRSKGSSPPLIYEYIRRQLVNKRIFILILMLMFSYFCFFSAISMILSVTNTDSIFKASGRICPSGTIPDREPGKSTDLID